MGGGENNEVSEEFVGLTDNIEPHPEKGGIKLTGYLTYNCLSINEDASQVRLKIMRFQDKKGGFNDFNISCASTINRAGTM